jgi:hypothetical protein
MSPIHASDKVVCVDDNFEPAARAWFSTLPRKGQVYDVRLAYQNVHTGMPTLLITGITGASPAPHRHEIGFRASRFRLLAEVRAMNQIAAGTSA